MRKNNFKSQLLTSVIVTILLIYFMTKATSTKLIFAPFLICSISMIGNQVVLLLGKSKLSEFFSKIFAISFFLFWFGFLVVAAYICLRDKQYGLLLYSTIFWIVGIVFAKNRFWGQKVHKTNGNIPPWGAVLLIISLITLLVAGIGLLVQGLLEKEFGLVFMGFFFFFGALTFVLGALTIKGCFDKCKIDILGLYIGIFFVLSGSGIIVIISQQQFGPWIIIPALMTVAGAIQIVKCLKNRKEE